MSALTNWLGEVFTVILSVTFLEILMPEGSIKKYIRFIFSLIIMAVIVTPLGEFLHK